MHKREIPINIPPWLKLKALEYLKTVKTKQNLFHESVYSGNQRLQPENFMCDSCYLWVTCLEEYGQHIVDINLSGVAEELWVVQCP